MNISINIKEGDILTVDVVDLAYGGDSVARYKNFVIFIPYGVPGQKVKIRITHKKKDFAYGEILEVIHKSSIEEKPICPLFKKCGGCDWLNIVYKKQLLQKEKIVKYMLRNIKIEKINNIIPSDKQFFYRQRAQYKVSKNKNNILIGFYKKKTHEVIDVEKCYLLNENINDFIKVLRKIINKNKISVYDEKSKKGYLRYICVRINQNGEILLTFVVNKNYISKELKNIIESIKNKYLKKLKGIILNINTSESNVIFGKEEKILYGQNYIVERVKDIDFILSDNTFFQVNIFMLNFMLTFIEKRISKDMVVLDLYGGVGSLSLPFYKIAKKIIIVEENKNTILNLEKTITQNNIQNAFFKEGKSENIVSDIFLKENIDIIIVDPPRKGLHKDVIENIKKTNIKHIIYISCNPATLARDLDLLQSLYDIVEITPLDLFPDTYHIETMVYMKRKE